MTFFFYKCECVWVCVCLLLCTDVFLQSSHRPTSSPYELVLKNIPNVCNGSRNKCFRFGGDAYTLSLVTTLDVCLGGGLRSPSAFPVWSVTVAAFYSCFVTVIDMRRMTWCLCPLQGHRDLCALCLLYVPRPGPPWHQQLLPGRVGKLVAPSPQPHAYQSIRRKLPVVTWTKKMNIRKNCDLKPDYTCTHARTHTHTHTQIAFYIIFYDKFIIN